MWDKIQPILDKKNMTANKLAELMGLKNNSLIYELKHGHIKKPSFELMEKIADALNVSMDDFRKDNGRRP
ncbi:helix-turn-helix domain-containing protein [Lentilactobacillus hilgardii]|uniref:helix-turn-helix domain-containing protein n=1 Tax=Lentilactobacillus hilgardii TaxID=1588 RepID=UPI0021A4E020|nr:helix-turn-helix transcriptional regulator [Lentilactobacillus hilgardii]MCT3390357.1 XRE family transcriptional regulator [Lentilactobacillus hilgardii]